MFHGSHSLIPNVSVHLDANHYTNRNSNPCNLEFMSHQFRNSKLVFKSMVALNKNDRADSKIPINSDDNSDDSDD